jgi:quercetin dioxygenase-like cupin family protein
MSRKGKNVETATKTQTNDTLSKQWFNAAGVLLQFLASPEEAGDSICVIRGTMPPEVVVPLHSHAEPEILYVLDGTLEVYREDKNSNDKEEANEWTTASAGDVITIPGHVKHALRNSSSLVPVSSLLATQSELYKFFREIAKPFDPAQPPAPPTPADLQELLAATSKHGYWMASPEENASIGLTIGLEAQAESADPLLVQKRRH